MYETNTTVVGTLITAVNRRRLPDGTSVVSFRVASNERRYDRANETWADGDTLYVSVTCWRKVAENVHASFVVGDPIIVHGRLFSRSFEKDGRRQSVTEMEAGAVGPDLARCTAAVTRTKRAEAAGTTTPAPAGVGQRPAATEDDPWAPALLASGATGDDRSGPGARTHDREPAVEAGVGA